MVFGNTSGEVALVSPIDHTLDIPREIGGFHVSIQDDRVEYQANKSFIYLHLIILDLWACFSWVSLLDQRTFPSLSDEEIRTSTALSIILHYKCIK
jgi:hypothetical protein